MYKLLKKIFKPRVKYDPLIRVLISKDALVHNLRAYRTKYPNLRFAPVLKSNAYGHGLVEISSILDEEQPPFFAVDSFYEALVLRQARMSSKILIIGYTREELMLKKTLRDVSFAILSLESLKNLASRLREPNYFQLKVDTGMHRQGVLVSELAEAFRLIKSNSNLVLEGIYTHFADADSPEESFTNNQILLWNEAVKHARRVFGDLPFVHAAATAGAAYSREVEGNVCRLGIGLYGINVHPTARLDLMPVLEMKSVLAGLKRVQAGDYVGYSRLFRAPKDMLIATVPAGYNEGVDLRLSNKGAFLVRGRVCPIVGRVSMNITTIDVTGLSDAKLEEEAIIFSRNPQDENSVERATRVCGLKNPREILIHIPAYLRREIV